MEINSIQFKCNFYPTNAALRRFLGRLVCIWTGRFPLLPHPTMMVLVDCLAGVAFLVCCLRN